MNFLELREKILNEYSVGQIASEDFSKKDLDLTLIHREGGREGDGEYVERVFKHTDSATNEDVYVKFTGFYSSYEGTEWDSEIENVKPKQKTITIYE